MDETLEFSTAYEFDDAIEATDLAKQLVDTCNLNGIRLIGNDQAKIKKAVYYSMYLVMPKNKL